MKDGEILKAASDAGWNVEHKATNDYIIKFANVLLEIDRARVARLVDAAERAADVFDDIIADYEGNRQDASAARDALDEAVFWVRGNA